jgi:hypothetical protein
MPQKMPPLRLYIMLPLCRFPSIFLRSMQEVFSIFGIFFDASVWCFGQQKGKFFNSHFENTQL